MKSLTILLISLLFLSSCSIDWNDEKDKKIVELEKQVIELKTKNDDELFKRNQECYSYKEKIGNYSNFMELQALFYSPIRKSCLSAIKYSTNNNVLGYFIEISDVLTNSTLFKDTNKKFDHAISFQEEIKYLKGEDYIKTTPELEELKILINNEAKKYLGDFIKSKLGNKIDNESFIKLIKGKEFQDEKFFQNNEWQELVKKSKATGGITVSIYRELYDK